MAFSPFSYFQFSFTFFNLFCFSSLCQGVVLLNFLDTKANLSSLLFSQRERERESPKSNREGVVGLCELMSTKLVVLPYFKM